MITVKIEIKYNPVKTGSMVHMMFKLFSLVKLIGVNGAEVNIEYTKNNHVSDVSIEHIRKIVSKYLNIDNSDMDIETRKREIVKARQITMYFSKIKTKNSLSYIGSKIGNKDHATVLHAYRTVINEIGTDKNYSKQINNIEKLLIGETIKVM
jgi:chromosomal replication initiator protein